MKRKLLRFSNKLKNTISSLCPKNKRSTKTKKGSFTACRKPTYKPRNIMKIKIRLLAIAFPTAALIFAMAPSAQAQAYAGLNFQIENNSGYADSNIWLMWQQAASGVNVTNQFSMTDGLGNAVTLDSFSVAFNGTNYNTLSTPVQLSANSNSVNGFHINYVNSGTLYVGVSTSGNPFSSSNAPAPNTDTFKYMPFEATITGAQGDQSDLTAINYASFPMSLTTYKAGSLTPGNQLQNATWGSGATGNGIINALIGAVGAQNAVTNSSGVVRVLGPSQSYDGLANTTTYPTFQPLLAKLYSQQTNPAAPNYGTAIKLSYTGNNGYTADAIVTTNASGYGLLITNVVVNKGTTEADLTNPATGTSITGGLELYPDTATNQPLAVTIYSGVLHNNTNGNVAGVWSGDLTNTYSSLQSTLLASLSASIVTGFAGSTTLFPGSTNEYAALDSNQWFTQNSPTNATNPGLLFSQLQPNTGGYYDPYFAKIEELSGYGIYGSPYADRMQNWTVDINSTAYGANSEPYSNWAPVSTMVLRIDPILVPEPSYTWAILLFFTGAAFYKGFQRRKKA